MGRKISPQSNAVIIAMMDTSGSMGSFEKYCRPQLLFLDDPFFAPKYENVEIVFIAHHTEAKEVTEEEFFTRAKAEARFAPRHTRRRLDIIDSGIRLPATIFIRFISLTGII